MDQKSFGAVSVPEIRSEVTINLFWERATGIEPAYLAWEASALPLSYARVLREF